MAVFLRFAGCADELRHAPKGTFYGVLPCADCSGIHYKITFGNDSVYSEEMVYLGKDEKVFSNAGNYTMDKNEVIMLKNKRSAALVGRTVRP